jgi:hypothetical protein
MFELPFAGAIGLSLGFSLGAIYGRSRALAGFWRRIDARMRELNASHRITIKTRDGADLTLEDFVAELKR